MSNFSALSGDSTVTKPCSGALGSLGAKATSIDPPPPAEVPSAFMRVAVVPKSASWLVMLSDVDPVPAVRMNRISTGISDLGAAPGVEGVASAALAAASTGAGGVGGRVGSSGGVTMATRSEEHTSELQSLRPL